MGTTFPGVPLLFNYGAVRGGASFEPMRWWVVRFGHCSGALASTRVSHEKKALEAHRKGRVGFTFYY